MNTQSRWIAYDWFKLIVALLLIALLLVLAFLLPSRTPVPTSGVSEPGGSGQAPAVGALQQPSATTAADQPTLTLAPQTPTPQGALTPTPLPLPSPSATAGGTATAAAAEPSPSAEPSPETGPVDCPLAAPSQLAVGDQAQVLARLNLRAGAGMDQSILMVSPPGSQVEVIGGPVCVPYQNGAYLWWNVRTQDGTTGWSAEASLSRNFYFLEPVP